MAPGIGGQMIRNAGRRSRRRIEHRQAIDALAATFEIRFLYYGAIDGHGHARNRRAGRVGFRGEPVAAGKIAGRSHAMDAAEIECGDELCRARYRELRHAGPEVKVIIERSRRSP